MGRTHRLAAVAALALAAAGGTPPLSSQQLHGGVRDSTSAVPIPGAVVSLLDSTGRMLLRTIADEGGRFAFTPPAGGVRLQVLRIGFRPRTVRVPAAGPDGDITVNVVMVRLTALLASVRVEDNALCPGSTEQGDAFTVWEQARSALLANVVGREAKPALVHSLTFHRVLDARTEHIDEQVVRSGTHQTNRPFVSGRAPSAFATEGYLEEHGQERIFHGPDAEVLLDESFAATHCFRIQREDGDHRDQVGLRFEPVPGRDSVVDVSGVLWLDRAVPALRTLEFRYTGIEPVGYNARAGGMISFLTADNGVVLIDHWKIRLPLLRPWRIGAAGAAVFFPRKTEASTVVLAAIQEDGAQIVSASWPDGASWRATLGEVTGRVVEEGTGRLVAGARVWLRNTDDTVSTDAMGSYKLSGLLPGPYEMAAAIPALAEMAIPQNKTHRAEPESGRVKLETLELSSLETLRERWCGDKADDKHPGAIIGRLTTYEGLAVARAHVTAAYIDIAKMDSAGAGEAQYDPPVLTDSMRTVTTASDGTFILCGLLTMRPIRLRTEGTGIPTTDARTLLLQAAPIRVLTVKLAPKAGP